MRSLKSSWHICLQNLRKWQTDYRIWIIGLMAVILIAVFEDGMRNIADYLGLKPPIWIFPFIYYQFYTKLSYMVLIILLFCNAPFTDQNQVFVLMRSGHKKWLLGQILYIVTASGLFYAFLLGKSAYYLRCKWALCGNFSFDYNFFQACSGSLVHAFVVISLHGFYRTAYLFLQSGNGNKIAGNIHFRSFGGVQQYGR